MVENLATSAGEARDPVLISGLGRSSGVGNCNPLSILSWKIPWTEEPDGLKSMVPQRFSHN